MVKELIDQGGGCLLCLESFLVFCFCDLFSHQCLQVKMLAKIVYH